MSEKMIVSSTETISCPKCHNQFPLADGIAKQTIEKNQQEYRKSIQEESERLRAGILEEVQSTIQSDFDTKVKALQNKLDSSTSAYKELEENIRIREKAAREKALADIESEKKGLLEDLAEKDKKLDQFREQQIALRREKARLEEMQKDMELELSRKLDTETQRIEEKVKSEEAERFRLKEAEYKKKIQDAQDANNDLKRKLEQGSQQLQGEVLELELEDILRAAFPMDKVEPVKKGARGADIIQTVVSQAGVSCGKIIWEAKRAEKWSDAWVGKLKDDQREVGADIAILVTTVMPVKTTEPFCHLNGIWVVNQVITRPLSETLRIMVMDFHRLKLINQDRSQKAETLYEYLMSSQFGHKIRAVIEAFVAMKTDLDAEKNAMQRIWKKREAQLNRISSNIMGICGEIEGITQQALPEVQAVAELPVHPEEDSGEEGKKRL